MSGFFAILNRLKYIDRWGLMHGTRRENVLEHSAMTAMLAHALALIENSLTGSGYDAKEIALKALYHETAESITGDLPTPVKYGSERITAAYKEIEKLTERRIADTLPDILKDALTPYVVQNRTESERMIIKAADKLAALIKCIEEKKAGNAEFAAAYETTLEDLKDSNLKSAEYFLENMLPAFGLTLDEILSEKGWV